MPQPSAPHTSPAAEPELLEAISRRQPELCLRLLQRRVHRSGVASLDAIRSELQSLPADPTAADWFQALTDGLLPPAAPTARADRAATAPTPAAGMRHGADAIPAATTRAIQADPSSPDRFAAQAEAAIDAAFAALEASFPEARSSDRAAAPPPAVLPQAGWSALRSRPVPAPATAEPAASSPATSLSDPAAAMPAAAADPSHSAAPLPPTAAPEAAAASVAQAAASGPADEAISAGAVEPEAIPSELIPSELMPSELMASEAMGSQAMGFEAMGEAAAAGSLATTAQTSRDDGAGEAAPMPAAAQPWASAPGQVELSDTRDGGTAATAVTVAAERALNSALGAARAAGHATATGMVSALDGAQTAARQVRQRFAGFRRERLSSLRQLMRDCVDETLALLNPEAEPDQEAPPPLSASGQPAATQTLQPHVGADGLEPAHDIGGGAGPLAAGTATADQAGSPAQPESRGSVVAPPPLFGSTAEATAQRPPATNRVRTNLTTPPRTSSGGSPAPAPPALADLRAWLSDPPDLPRAS